MAQDWIKVECVTPDKPEVYQIAEALGIEPEHAFGCLVIVWIWADQQTIDGNAPSVTRKLIDRKAGVTGFADAMLLTGWLEEEGGTLTLPNFDIHNGKSAKSRAQTARRVAKHKALTQLEETANADSVTSALPREEKRREDNTTTHTTRARAIPNDFKPTEQDYHLLSQKAIPREFVDQQIEEFIAYWQERNDAFKDWRAKFRNRVIQQWSRSPKRETHSQNTSKPESNHGRVIRTLQQQVATGR